MTTKLPLRRAYVVGLPTRLRDGVTACFPQFEMIWDDLAEAVLQTGSRNADGVGLPEPGRFEWCSLIEPTDCLFVWGGLPDDLSSPAALFELDRGPFGASETAARFSCGFANYELRLISGDPPPELAGAEAPRFEAFRNCASNSDKTLDVVVVGNPDAFAVAIERHPGRSIAGVLTSKRCLEAAVVLAEKGVRLAADPEMTGAMLIRARTVVSDAPEIALAAAAAGAAATCVGAADSGAADRPEGSSPADGQAFQGFAAAPAGEALTAQAVAERWTVALGSPETQISFLPAPREAKQIVVGQQARIAKPLGRCFGPAAYHQRGLRFTPAELEANASSFGRSDIVIAGRKKAFQNWARASAGGVKRLVEILPHANPMGLPADDTVAPIFGCHRFKRQGGAFVYATAEDVERLTPAERAEFAAEGRRIRPFLAKLRTAGGVARHTRIEMGRRIGPIGSPRILVLGRRETEDGAIDANPDSVSDVDVVMAALNSNWDARILYAPDQSPEGRRQAEAVEALSPRVEVISTPYGVSEYAHIVSGVWTIDSPLGLFALVAGLPVSVFGRPFYGGLGVTRDLDAAGAERAPLVSAPLDIDAFLGWHFRANVYFADPLSGEPIDLETYATDWSPHLGDLSDEVAARLVGHASRPGVKAATLLACLRALGRHGKRDFAAKIVDGLDLTTLIAESPPIVHEAARQLAIGGQWREAVSLAFAAWRAQGQSAIDAVADTLAKIRSLLSSSAEVAEFEGFILSRLRSLSTTQLLVVADAFRSKGYFSTALTCYRGCLRSTAQLASVIRCHLGAGELGCAARLFAELEAGGGDVRIVAALRQELNEERGLRAETAQSLEASSAAAPTDQALKLKLAKAYRVDGRFEDAAALLHLLLPSGQGDGAIRELASLYLQQMQAPKARGLLGAFLDSTPTDPACWRLLGQAHSFENDLEAACECYYTALTLAPLDITTHVALVELEAEIEKATGRSPGWAAKFDELIANTEELSPEVLIAHGRSRLQAYDFEPLKRNCLTTMRLFPEDGRAHCWYAHALAWEMPDGSSKDLASIRAHYEVALARSSDNCDWILLDAFRGMAHVGDVASIRALLRERRTLFRDEASRRVRAPLYYASLCLGDFATVFEGFRRFKRTATLQRNAKDFRLALSLGELRPDDRVLFLSEGGVGDELRYSTLYPELLRAAPNACFSVDERLLTLFQRSFPKVRRFVPLPRLHQTRLNRDMLGEIDGLPDLDLAPFFNNELWTAAREADVVLLASCALADIRRSEKDFGAGAKVRLLPREDLASEWRERLGAYSGRLLVGATWTSLLRDYRRVENYLTHEEMAPIFSIPGVTFVNCQYENVDAELAWARETLGIEILDFPDLDKRNDFEGLAALISCLDLFVGTATTTTEFAALVGCPTIYASPSNLSAYRNAPGSEKDLYFPNMRHIRPIPAVERAVMIDRIVAIIGEFARRKDNTAPRRKA